LGGGYLPGMGEPDEEMERDLQDMEERAGEVDEHIDETRKEWERKQSDSAVPGAEPDEEPES
jgi:hypothetical protein